MVVVQIRDTIDLAICHDIYPARGRKLKMSLWQTLPKLPFATIFTPQGDGNTLQQWLKADKGIKICHDIYPARGRKLLFPMYYSLQLDDLPRYLPRKGTETCFRIVVAIANSNLPRYLPRKGTETKAKGLRHQRSRRICHDIYPARGRKREELGLWLDTSRYLPRYLPRKGTETFKEQGRSHGATFYQNLPRYLPRKGTETQEGEKRQLAA